MAEKKIQIIYDINGKPIDVAIDKTLNLRQQTRLLTAELNKTKEGTREFTLLTSKLNDAKDGMERVRAKSSDLFAALGLLPGPVGSFFSQLNGVLGLMKTFTSFSLKDIGNQFKELRNDLADVYRNIFGAKNVSEDLASTNSKLSESTQQVTKSVNQQSQVIATGTNNLGNYAIHIDGLKKAAEEYTKKTGKAVDSTVMFDRATGQFVSKADAAAMAINNTSKATEAAAVKFGAATLAGRLFGQALTTVGVSATSAAIAVGLLETALMAIGIGVIIAGVVALATAIKDLTVGFYESVTGIKAARKELEEINTTIENTNELLDLDVKGVKRRTDEYVAFLKSKGKNEKEIRQASIEGLKEELKLVETAYDDLGVQENKLLKNRESTTEQYDKITKRRTELDQRAKDLRTAIRVAEYNSEAEYFAKSKELADKDYQRRLADLDARIQLEIDKDNTSRKILQDLLDKKRNLIVNHDKYTYAQAQLLKQENSKRLEQALQEDADRWMNFYQKQEEIRINAIDEQEQQELEARESKLYFDKVAISKEIEFKKKSEEEKKQIFTNMEEAMQMDLIKIREKYFLKRLQQEQEQFLKQQSVYTTGFENLAESAKLGLQKEAKYQLLHQKTLKDFYAARFVDLRGAYQMEYDEVNKRLEQDKLTLQKALEDKKLTQEQYALSLMAINDKIAENNQRLFDRQRQLDQLEVDAKRAQTDMLIQIGNNLVGLLQAIAGKSKKLQVAAALTEAAVSIARVVVDTSRAIIAFSASVAPLGPAGVPMAAAYAVKAKIAAALAIGTIIAQGVNKLKEINTQDETGAGTGGGTPYNGLGRNYEEGGVIRGRRHAQGGVMIEAEGGEAIMTRGAVSMFSPMLSLMNQMGGGAPFNKSAIGQASFDNPNVANYGNVPQPTIIKSYVVSQDMTSEIQKQERLKDLSTL